MVKIYKDNFENFNIPENGKNNIEDLKIENFCKKNPHLDKCKCIIPDISFKFKIESNNYTPYYCIYPPCYMNGYYKTSLILEKQKQCNTNLCFINIGDIKMENTGNLKLKNNCIHNLKFNNTNIPQIIIDYPIKSNYNLPNFFSYSYFFYILSFLNLLFIL